MMSSRFCSRSFFSGPSATSSKTSSSTKAIGERLGVAGGGLTVIEAEGGDLSLSAQAGGLELETPERVGAAPNSEAATALQATNEGVEAEPSQ